MPAQDKYSEIYKVGDEVWHHVSKAQGAWKLGTVHELEHDMYHSGIRVVQPASKVSRFIPDWNQWDVIPRKAINPVPAGTIYLIDTKIGMALSKRTPGLECAVYECSTRLVTNGVLLGYIVLPYYFHRAIKLYQHGSTWFIPPNTKELISFLDNKLDDIREASLKLSG